MRVLETLSTPNGLPSIFRYRRDSRGLHVVPVASTDSAFEMRNASWAELLTELDDLDEGALFSLEREVPHQAPYSQLYEVLRRLDIISDGDNQRPPNYLECACIASILFHEGYFVHHQGGLGPGRQTARIILRRSR